MAWLRDARPGLVPRYERLYAPGAYVPAEYRTWLARRVAPLLVRHGLDRRSGGAARGTRPAPRTRLPGREPAHRRAAGRRRDRFRGGAQALPGEQLSLL